MALAKLMTNLLPDLYQFLRTEAKEEKTTIRQIIEQAIELYKREKRKREIIKGYQGLENDHEYLEEMRQMAEMGMKEYSEILHREENEYK